LAWRSDWPDWLGTPDWLGRPDGWAWGARLAGKARWVGLGGKIGWEARLD
jgi:hypothetical protein